jgi:hypothetical protein
VVFNVDKNLTDKTKTRVQIFLLIYNIRMFLLIYTITMLTLIGCLLQPVGRPLPYGWCKPGVMHHSDNVCLIQSNHGKHLPH